MSHKFLKIALLLCLSTTLAYAQDKKTKTKPEKKRGMLSYSVSYSDYGFIKALKDSSFSYALNRKGLFKSGTASYGFVLSYWKGLTSRVDFTLNLDGTFSNFPALFVKGDSIGRASFTPQIDALLHIKAFKETSTINPFLTGGVGAGYFGKQLAVYAPVGAGLQFRFKKGAFVFVQAQWRMALTEGITNDYTFYSLGFAYKARPEPKKEPTPPEIPSVDTVKKDVPVVGEKDTDGDGFIDSVDECPTVKGTIRGCPDSDGDGIADKEDQCKDVFGLAKYNGCPVPDTDGDGVNDDEDNCPNEAGVKDNRGCPADSDGDGILDKDDKCPNSAGTAENSGCPITIVEGAKLLRSNGDSMTYYIRFDFDQAIITAEAFAELKQIVAILKADKTLNLKIEGHADKFGLEKYNLLISSDRANVTRDYFLSYGIARTRMKTAYFGSSIPYDIHQDWLNRRVEITIYKKK